MTQIKANSIQLEYESLGDPSDPALVIVRGLGTQMTNWSQAFLDSLVSHGFHVVRFDNRDVGLSQKFDAGGVPDLSQMMSDMAEGRPIEPAYTLADMAADVIGLMDTLRIHQAHILGMSLGGMIVQTIAANHPERLLSLTSIMSSSGDRRLPPATPEAMAALMARAKTNDREDVIQTNLESNRVYSSPGFPDPVDMLYEREGTAYDRCYCPDGAARQSAAVISAGDRSEALKSIRVPTLVIHGVEDTLIPVEHGKDCAAKIPGARLELIDGMGHDLPLALTARITGLIADHALGKRAA